MKKIITTAIVSGLMAMVAVPAMAAPHGHHNHPGFNHHPSQAHKAPNKHPGFGPKFDHKKPGNGPKAKQKHLNAKHKVMPHRDWRRGQVLASPYRGQGYWVNYKQHPRLHTPGKNQRWVRVNGDYVLVNTLSNVIVSILTGR